MACILKKYQSFFLVSFLVFVVACDGEERPTYEVIENILPAGGPGIELIDQTFKNIEALRAPLSVNELAVFEQSLQWFATESSFGLEKLKGKTARQVVDIVNCLKVSGKSEHGCFS